MNFVRALEQIINFMIYNKPNIMIFDQENTIYFLQWSVTAYFLQGLPNIVGLFNKLNNDRANIEFGFEETPINWLFQAFDR